MAKRLDFESIFSEDEASFFVERSKSIEELEESEFSIVVEP